MTDPKMSEQYKTDENLRIRIETHQRYTVGPPLEPAIDRALDLSGEESILDIGTGPGDFPQRIRRSGHRGRIVGIDASQGMIDKARSIGAGVQFLQADAQSLPFSDNRFDVVTARHMLYHVADIPRALREAHRVLRPHGRFLAVTNAQNNFAEYRQALREAAEELKDQIADVLRIVVPASNVFNERTGPALMEEVFASVSVNFVEAALRFETTEPPLRYFDSCRTMKGLSAEDWSVAREAFARALARRLLNGPWLISKGVVLLIGQKT
jgi:SAM-dependent methyltransferase